MIASPIAVCISSRDTMIARGAVNHDNLIICSPTTLLSDNKQVNQDSLQHNNRCQAANVSNGTKCSLVNSRSIREKTMDIREFILEHKLDFLFITETWLSGNSSDGVYISEVKPIGYTFSNFPRTVRRGGGLALLHKDGIRVSSSRPKDYDSFEWIESIAHTNHGRFKFILIYRPPPSVANRLTVNAFLADFSDLLDIYSCDNTPFAILGDLNVRINIPGDRETVKFTNLLESHGLVQLVNEPTHRSAILSIT